MRRALVLVASTISGGLLACGEPPMVPIEVTTGQEEGALGLDPAVATVEIAATSPDGQVQLLTAAAPGEEFELGEAPDTSILSFELTGKTTDGEIVARGRSVSVAVGALDVEILPLFIQRLGSFGRPPGGLVRAHMNAPGGVLGERFLIATGGDSAVGEEGPVDPALGDYYDMLGFAGFESSASLPRAARSMVVRDSRLFLIDDDGASIADLASGAISELASPDGFEFSEVSGGLAVEAGNGLTYVVGGTRSDPPSNAVFVFDAAGNSVSAVRLATARAGAAALYVEGVGLTIIGGSSEGAGVETVKDDGVTVASIPFPSDATTGAAAVIAGEQKITVFAGRIEGAPATTRTFDLRCIGEECASSALESVPVPDIAARGRAFASPLGSIVIGENEDGETLVFLVSLDTPGEERVDALPLREPRRGATAIPAPNGTLALLGGVTLTGAPASSVELLFPE